jgi:hypothetical protein
MMCFQIQIINLAPDLKVKNREEYERGRGKKKEDGEHDCPEEKLLHLTVRTVHPIPKGVVLLGYKGIEAVDGNGEEHEQVPKDGDLDDEGCITNNVD